MCSHTMRESRRRTRTHFNPITPATHLSHAFREASPNYTCLGLLSFGSRNKLCPPPRSPCSPFSPFCSLFLSLSQGYFPVFSLVCVALLKTSQRASLPHPQATPPPARDTGGGGGRGQICICELNFCVWTPAARIGEAKLGIKQVIFTAFKSAVGGSLSERSD